MDEVRAYLLRVTVAALVCGIISGFAAKRVSIAPLVKFLCSLLMAIVLLTPMASIRLDSLASFWEGVSVSGDDAAFSGYASAQEACGDIIKEKVAAYVLDKAEAYGAELTVEVTLDDSMPPVPCGLEISGRISPYGKTALTNDIEKELGIKAEDQIWTG